MNLEFSPATLSQLEQVARERGCSVEDVIYGAVTRTLSEINRISREHTDAEKAREMAHQDLIETLAGVREGLGDMKAGRTRSVEEFQAVLMTELRDAIREGRWASQLK